MRTIKSVVLLVSLLAGINLSLPGQQQTSEKKSIYHNGWIDLNKNGRMDVYENPKAPLNRRIEDLLSQMTLEEKTCQAATLYGVGRGRTGAEPPLKDELPTPNWKNQIWKDGIANIDEHLNGVGPNGKSIYATDIKKHVWAMNEVQRFFIEDTRLGIPTDFTNEGVRGLAAYTATSFPAQIGQGWRRDGQSDAERLSRRRNRETLRHPWQQ